MAQIPKEQVVKIRAELDTAVVVRPGDKLVLACARSLTMAEARTVKERVAEQLPGVEAVIVDGVASMAVYRDEGVRKVSRTLSADEVASLREIYGGNWPGTSPEHKRLTGAE